MLCTVEYHNESLAISFLYISSAWSNAFVCRICGEFDGLRAWVMRGSWDVGDLGKERTAEWNDSVRHSGICTRKLPGHALVRFLHAKDIFPLGITAADYVSSIIYGHIHLAALLVKHWSIAKAVRIMIETVICHTMTSVPCFTWEHVFLNFLTWLTTYFHTLAALQW
jgi:hypothetical protein